MGRSSSSGIVGIAPSHSDGQDAVANRARPSPSITKLFASVSHARRSQPAGAAAAAASIAARRSKCGANCSTDSSGRPRRSHQPNASDWGPADSPPVPSSASSCVCSSRFCVQSRITANRFATRAVQSSEYVPSCVRGFTSGLASRASLALSAAATSGGSERNTGSLVSTENIARPPCLITSLFSTIASSRLVGQPGSAVGDAIGAGGAAGGSIWR